MSDDAWSPSADGLLAVPAWDRSRDRRVLWVLVAVVLVVYLVTATYDSFQVNDNRAVNLSAWALGTQGTLELPASWEGGNRWIVEGRDGALYTNRFPGAIVWASPFHAVGEVVGDQEVPGHPVFLNYAPGGVAAATAAALAVGVSFLVFRRLAGRRLALAASVVLAFGTGTWSVSADAMWTHGLTQLTLLLGVLAAVDGRHVRSGLGFAAAVFTRPHTAFVAATVGIWRSAALRRWRPMIVIGVVSSIGVLALTLYSFELFGVFGPVAGYATTGPGARIPTGLLAAVERLGLALVHPLRGVFVYAPFLVVLLPFVRYGWRDSAWWVRSAAVAGAVYLAVQLWADEWAGGGGYFGSRLALETLTLLAPLLLRTWQVFVSRRERLKGACVGLIVVAVLTHGLGATVRSVHPESAQEWREELGRFCRDNPGIEGC